MGDKETTNHFWRTKPVLVVVLFTILQGAMFYVPWDKVPFDPAGAVSRLGEVYNPRVLNAAFQNLILWKRKGSTFTEQDTIKASENPRDWLIIPKDWKGDGALDQFYEKLSRLKDPTTQKETKVHIMHFGDSIIWADNITGKLRELMQTEFSNGGRGLMPIVQSPDYRILGVKNTKHKNWRIEKLTTNQKHGLSLGATLYRFEPLGIAESSFRFKMKPAGVGNPFGESLQFIYEPNVNDSFSVAIQTGSKKQKLKVPLKKEGVTSIPLDGVPKKLKLKAKAGQIHFGMFASNPSGLLYSPVIRMGIFSQDYRFIKKREFVRQLKIIKPDLIIFQYGKNEVGWSRFSLENHLQGIQHMVALAQAVADDIDIMLIGPAGRLYVSKSGNLHYLKNTAKVISGQRQIALEQHLAYFDSQTALGGKFAFKDMIKFGYVLDDYVHLSRKGGDLMAGRLYDALMAGFNDYTERKNNASLTDFFKKNQSAEKKTKLKDSSKLKKSKQVTKKQKKTKKKKAAKLSKAEAKEAAKLQKELKAGGPQTSLPNDEQAAKDKETAVNPLFSGKAQAAIYFDSKEFALFFIFVLFGFWLIRNSRWRFLFLLVASYYFYMSWNTPFITLVILSTVTDYFIGHWIFATPRRFTKSLFLVISLTVNLGLLFTFKYYDFVVSLTPENWQLATLGLILPVGISFYTFQTLSYTIDIHSRREPGKIVERSFVKFALFVSFFPQIISGPIVRARELLPQFYNKFRLHNGWALNGIWLIAIGLFKKIAIANYLGNHINDRVFATPEMFSSVEILAAIYGYGIQIYCDFSGYTDIAIGTAALLGFHFPRNFNRPYKAKSLTEFWHRWHMTLSRWLRDYLYIPLGGGRVAKPLILVNLMVVFILGGIWHGNRLTFLYWGLWHGLWLCWERVSPFRKIGRQNKLVGFFRTIVTLHIVLAGWVVFRADSWQAASSLFNELARFTSTIANLEVLVVAVIAGAFFLHYLPRSFYRNTRRFVLGLPSPVLVLVCLMVSMALTYLSQGKNVPFIYFQF